MQTRQPLERLDLVERPRIDRRLLNHWDNLDGTIERGYAGPSLWTWHELPGRIDPRIEDYARANASIGINGTVLNNVNAHPDLLTDAVPRKSGRDRQHAAALWHSRLPVGELRGAPNAGPAAHGRSARRRRGAMVARQGGRDLHPHSRLRRLPREGQQRRTARPAGLRPDARRRRQRARRCRRASRRHRHVARVRLRRKGRTPIASSVRISSSRRSTAASATT